MKRNCGAYIFKALLIETVMDKSPKGDFFWPALYLIIYLKAFMNRLEYILNRYRISMISRLEFSLSEFSEFSLFSFLTSQNKKAS